MPQERERITIDVERPTGPRITYPPHHGWIEPYQHRAVNVSKRAAVAAVAIARHKMVTAVALTVATTILTHTIFSVLLLMGAGYQVKLSSSYTGPGDVVSGALGAWGLRSYNAAYATGSNPAADICDVATGLVCTTINFLSNGSFDVATAAASSPCAVACNVSKLYDSTGNARHATQTTNSSRPTLTFNCINTSLPCLTNAAGQGLAVDTGIGTIAQPWTIVAVCNRTGSVTNFSNCYGEGSGHGILNVNSANTIAAYGGTIFNTTASDNAFHSLIGVGNSTSSIMNVDNGTTSTGNGGTNSLAGTTQQIMSGGFGSMVGTGTEWIVYGSAISAGNQTSLCHNQFLYWATAVSC